jgi:ADP-ribose pyrophosphatase
MRKIEGKNGLPLFALKTGAVMKLNIFSISKYVVFKGRIADIVHQIIRTNGSILEYEVIHRSPIVVIVPILACGDFIILNQYRASINREIWEFPAGTIEGEEYILEAARRELKEETGYEASEISLLADIYTAPHFSDERMFICAAKGLIPGISNHQEKEFIATHQISEKELLEKIKDKEIVDGKTLLAYGLCRNLIK